MRRPSRWERFSLASITLNVCFQLTFVIFAMIGFVTAVALGLCYFAEHIQPPTRVIIPACVHASIVLWFFMVEHWADNQERKLDQMRQRTVEAVERSSEYDAQADGVRMVLWGVVAGAWLALAAEIILASLFR